MNALPWLMNDGRIAIFPMERPARDVSRNRMHLFQNMFSGHVDSDDDCDEIRVDNHQSRCADKRLGKIVICSAFMVGLVVVLHYYAIDPQLATMTASMSKSGDDVHGKFDGEVWHPSKLTSDSCPWLAPTAVDNQLQCSDGSLCFGWGCCSWRGGRRKCPPNRPVMCNQRACGGDHCCRQDCRSFGGPRLCGRGWNQPNYQFYLSRYQCPDWAVIWQGFEPLCKKRCTNTPECVYYTTHESNFCKLSTSCFQHTASTDTSATIYKRAGLVRVLFIGNSYTYINDLPNQLATVASSLGKAVEVAVSAHGGCCLYGQMSENDGQTDWLMQQHWDFIVLQDHSQVPSLKRSRDAYFYPALRDFVSNKGAAKVVLFLTPAHHDGIQSFCFDYPMSPNCWPLGTLKNFYQPECDEGKQMHIAGYPCMQYAISRGYFAALNISGADMVFPAGLTWQAVKGGEWPPSWCREIVDWGFDDRWAPNVPPPVDLGITAKKMLHGLQFNLMTGGHFDTHPSLVGQYLNALTLYATLFRESPVGSDAQPSCKSNCISDGWVKTAPGELSPPLSRDIMLELQNAAATVVESCGKECFPDSTPIFFKK